MTDKRIARERTPKDDLTVIKGIKETRQHLLRTALAIHTYDDLAQASAETILGVFRADGQPITLASVQAWIAEAARLAATRAAHRRETARVSGQDSKWRSLGLFFIEFQTWGDPTRGPIYRTKIHNYERDTDHFLEGVDSGTIWEYLRHELEQDAPHLTAMLQGEAQAQPMPMAAAQVAPPAVPPEERLHDVLAQIEGLVQREPTPAPTSAHTPSASPAQAGENAFGAHSGRLRYYLEKYGIGAAAASPQASAPPAAEPDRLRWYLEKYGDGITKPDAASATAQRMRAAPVSDDPPEKETNTKLRGYLAKYGSV